MVNIGRNDHDGVTVNCQTESANVLGSDVEQDIIPVKVSVTLGLIGSSETSVWNAAGAQVTHCLSWFILCRT